MLYDEFEESLRDMGVFDQDIDFISAKAAEFGMIEWIYLSTVQEIMGV